MQTHPALTASLDYGIDAPGVRRMFFAMGGVGLVASLVFAFVALPGPAWLIVVLRATLVLATIYGIGMAAYMTYGSRVGKLRTRDRLLGHVAWRGDERVLDVGCGRGLMTIGAAFHVPNGSVVGIDLWSTTDQADNTPDAARENARRVGVADRIQIDTGDMRALPYDANTFDVVLSHWVVHNVEAAQDRAQALDEMLRVLRPTGWLILADITHHAEYIAHLTAAGVTHMIEERGGLESDVIGFFSGNTFRPQAIVARKPSV